MDDDGFTKVRYKKSRHGASAQSQGTVILPTNVYTVLFTPTDPETNLKGINRRALSDQLKSLAPGQTKEARVNTRRNTIVVDAATEAAILSLLISNSLGSKDVGAYLPRPKNPRAGVNTDVVPTLTDDQIGEELSSRLKIHQVHRFGTTTSVKVIFEGDTLPAHVKLGLERHRVRPFIPRPLQCRQCHAIGHVAGSCPNGACCLKCWEGHRQEACQVSTLKCVNCGNPHEATSRDCPKLQK
ncbi:unnamed protein product, partial [Ixodes hexagonus]